MSYCRWSSDRWRSDVYVYEDVSGYWTTHVASIHPVIPGPSFDFGMRWPWWLFSRLADLWMFFTRLSYRPIKGPCDGESFRDDTAGECALRLRMLRGFGYWIPQYALDELDLEARENALDEVPL